MIAASYRRGNFYGTHTLQAILGFRCRQQAAFITYLLQRQINQQ
jgi:hypothetical protein